MIDPVDQTDCRPDVFWTTGNTSRAISMTMALASP